jgi:hypothetical protein
MHGTSLTVKLILCAVLLPICRSQRPGVTHTRLGGWLPGLCRSHSVSTSGHSPCGWAGCKHTAVGRGLGALSLKVHMRTWPHTYCPTCDMPAHCCPTTDSLTPHLLSSCNPPAVRSIHLSLLEAPIPSIPTCKTGAHTARVPCCAAQSGTPHTPPPGVGMQIMAPPETLAGRHLVERQPARMTPHGGRVWQRVTRRPLRNQAGCLRARRCS